MDLAAEGIVVVTGAGGGLGAGLAAELTRESERRYAFVSRSRDTELRASLLQNGLDPEKHIFSAHLEREDDVSRLRREIEDRLGHVSGLVNLAGSSTSAVSWKLSLEAFQQVIADNLTSTFLCCREFAAPMRERGFGRIINTPSIVAHTGIAGAAHYAAAKAGIEGFTRSIALELGPKGITANTLALGYFEAGLIEHVPQVFKERLLAKTPAGRLGTISELGCAIEFLLSPGSSYVTGQVLHLNGGLFT